MTIAEKILRFIEKHENGLRFGEIQRFIVEEIHGLNYDEMEYKRYYCTGRRKWNEKYKYWEFMYEPIEASGKRRKYRGYYCTNLFGSRYRHGLLSWFCERYIDENKHIRYKINKKIEPPFYVNISAKKNVDDIWGRWLP